MSSLSAMTRFCCVRIAFMLCSRSAALALGSGPDLLLDGEVLHRLLQLLEGAHLDLPHALARDPVFLGEVLEGGRVLLETPLDEDAPLARIERFEGRVEKLAPPGIFLALGELGLLVLLLVDQPVLP